MELQRTHVSDPRLGRFISEDPIGFIGGDANFYAYVENDPISYKDPLGLMKVKQGVVVPTGALLINLKCLEECLGTNVEIRITETTGAHSSGNPHTRGLAADFTVGPRDPFVNPKRPTSTGLRIKDVLCCARACSFNFSQYETSLTPGATAPHFHVQIPPGRGGAIRPTQTDCCE
jgi:hypothetical protein